MYCKHCGREIDDRAVFCPHCGVATGNTQNFDPNGSQQQNYNQQNNNQQYNGQQYYNQPYTPQPIANRGLVTAAKVFIIIGIVLSAINIFSSAIDIIEELSYIADGSGTYYLTLYIIALAVSIIWIIPGIIFGLSAIKSIKAKVKPSTAVSVCVLIFTNIIGGILLLCTKNGDYI